MEKNKQIPTSFIKRLTIIIGFKIIVIVFFLLYNTTKINNTKDITINPQFCFNERCINLELADTPQKRELGLMFRENLDEDMGMLFAFPEEDYHGVWMRNTLIPLDILWINSNYEIVHIISAQPCKKEICTIYKPTKKSLRVIEIKKGKTKELGIQTGDTIELKIPNKMTIPNQSGANL